MRLLSSLVSHVCATANMRHKVSRTRDNPLTHSRMPARRQYTDTNTSKGPATHSRTSCAAVRGRLTHLFSIIIGVACSKPQDSRRMQHKHITRVCIVILCSVNTSARGVIVSGFNFAVELAHKSPPHTLAHAHAHAH